MKPRTQFEKEQLEETSHLKVAGAKAVGLIYNLANLAKAIGSQLPVIGNLLFIIYRLGYLVNHLFNLSLTLTTNKEDAFTKSMRGVLHFTSAAVAITKLVMSKIPMPVAILTDVADCLESTWNIGLSVKSFLTGAWKRHSTDIAKKKDERARLKEAGASNAVLTIIDNEITASKNKIINKKAKLATRIEKLVVNTSFLIGSVFLLVPPLALVGFGILLATGIYSVMDRFNLNPFKHIGKALFGNPFVPKPFESSTAMMATAINQQTPEKTVNVTPVVQPQQIANQPTPPKKMVIQGNLSLLFAQRAKSLPRATIQSMFPKVI